MELIIGGAYNSKLNFVLKYYNLKQKDFQNGAECSLDEAFDKKGIYNLHLLIKRFILSGIDDYNNIIEKILSSNIEIIICSEVGNGVVPVDKIDNKMNFPFEVIFHFSESDFAIAKLKRERLIVKIKP